MRFAPILFLALGCLLSIAGAQWDEKTIQAQTAPTPARVTLERMSPTERANARISVEFESSDDEAISLGRQVERLWNGGQYDEALVQLDNLEARVGRVAIGNSWRKPVPTLATDFWGRDVRIGNRDSLLELAFDAQLSSGNLFVVLRSGGGMPHYSVCMSTDTGATWDETFTWTGSPPTALDAEVVLNHLYVVYDSPGENAQQVRLRRFRCSTGLADTFHNWAIWVVPCTLDVGDTMREVSIVSNQHGANNRLYITTLVSDGSMLFSWDDANAVSWVKQSTGITSGASYGLDATENQDFDSTYLFLSYHDTSDTLRIYGKAGGFEQRFSRLTGAGTPTSISAYHDTIICAFEDGISSPHQVRYATNYGDGDAWTVGTLSDADTAAQAPGVTARGGGFAAVFRHLAPTRELRFRRRTYDGPWSDPVSIADNEPYWNRPGIEDLGAGVFGIVYLSNTSPVVRGAYFDRSDWVSGLAEQRRLIVDENILGVTPNPLKGHGRLNYTLNRPAYLRVQVYDRAGRAVRTLFDGHSPAGRQSLGFDARGMAPGVYFVRADADGRALTVPMTVVK